MKKNEIQDRIREESYTMIILNNKTRQYKILQLSEKTNTHAKVLIELQNSVSKDKIRNKIEEVRNMPNNPKQKVLACQIDAALINCLNELLEE